MFEFCIPTRATSVPTGPDWLHEIKYDGYRLRLERDGRGVRCNYKGIKFFVKRDTASWPRVHGAPIPMRCYHAPRGRIGIGKENAMKASSLFAVSIAPAILLIVPANAATPSGTATGLPTIVVQAPKQVAPHTVRHRAVAHSTVSRRTSATNQTSSARPMSVAEKIAKIEKSANTCDEGCVTSFKYGNDPWHGCSWSSGTFSPTCKNSRRFKTYVECKETGVLLGWTNSQEYWYCSSLALK